MRARLRAAVRLNASQELLCGVLHALSGCRQLVLLLKPACADAPAAAALRPADPHLLAPRLLTLQAARRQHFLTLTFEPSPPHPHLLTLTSSPTPLLTLPSTLTP